MNKAATDRLEAELRLALPEAAIERIRVLEYGDDPGVEPGETGIRVFISRAGRPEGKDENEEIVRAFEAANRPMLKKARERMPRFIGWVEFRPEGPNGAAEDEGPILRIGGPGGRARSLDDVSDELTSVMTRLGPVDLATVDTLIAAGVGTSRAEVLRWAIGRIREHPAYARLQERVQEIDELKAEF